MLFTICLIYLTVSFKCAADFLLNADLGKGKLYMLKLLTCKVHSFNWPSVIITDKKNKHVSLQGRSTFEPWKLIIFLHQVNRVCCAALSHQDRRWPHSYRLDCWGVSFNEPPELEVQSVQRQTGGKISCVTRCSQAIMTVVWCLYRHD